MEIARDGSNLRRAQTLRWRSRPFALTEETTLVDESVPLVIEPLLIGVCSADLKELRAERGTRHDLGHEVIAIVRRARMPNVPSPGALICLNPNGGVEKTTGFADVMVLNGEHSVLANACVAIPQGQNIRRLVFTEPLSCALNCVRRVAKVRPLESNNCQTMLVIGASIFGVLIALAARRMGYSVTLANRSAERLDFARARVPNVPCVALNDLSWPASSPDHIVVLATSFCTEEVIKLGLSRLAEGGLLHIFGGTVESQQSEVLGMNVDKLRRESAVAKITANCKSITLSGSYDATGDDFRDAFRKLMIDSDGFPVESLISREISLEQLPDHLETALSTTLLGKTLVWTRQGEAFRLGAF